jgi:hypothetical protein
MKWMLDRSSLNPLSRSFAELLFQEFGEWEKFAELLPDPYGSGGSAMEVTVAQTGTDRALRVRTDDNEITVGYDMWHTHVGAFMGISDSEAIELALADIRSIIAEQSVIVVVYRDGKWERSSLEYADSVVAVDPGSTTHVYSWKGTYDRVA